MKMKKLLTLLFFMPVLCFSQVVISNKAVSGPIGTAASTVNAGSLIYLDQTTDNVTLTVPNLIGSSASKFIYMMNRGTATFTLSPGGRMTSGSGVILVWTSAGWNVLGNGSPPLANPGTVTSITGGFGINGGTITSSGGFSVDTSAVGLATPYDLSSGLALKRNISDVVPVANGGTGVSVAGITALNNITGWSLAGATGASNSSVVMSSSPTINSPTLTSPVLGTPASGNLQNTTGFPASGLTGTALASNVVNSSLTSVGTLANLTVTNPISGSITGNAATVTTIPSLSGDASSSGNNVTVAGTVVKSVVLNTPNVLYTNPINFSTSSSTATGTLSLNTQSTNTVFSGPPTGSAATPTFRSLVANDIPSLTASKISDLGTAATKNVGTTAGTVAAGDDSRIKGFTILNYTTSASPADATTYYIGSVGTMTMTTAGLSSIARRKYINVTGTITSAEVYIINNTTDASTETSTLYIRINDATDYTISTGIQFSTTSSGKVYNITGLSIPVTAGDYEVSKLVTATWATNPVQSHIEIVYYIQ